MTALFLAIGFGICVPACGGSSSGSGTASGSTPKFGSEEFGLTRDELAAKVEKVESLIGRCMTDAGFEYVPVDFERVKAGMDADKSAPGLSDEEFVKQYGYGITTQAAKPGREIGLGERNVQIYNALDPSEQSAYNHTLFGDNIEATFAQSLEAEDFSQTGGCTRAAVGQSFTAAELSADYLNPADAAMDQDRRMVDAIAKWSDCVRNDGYDYANPDAVEEDLHQRLDAITEGAPIASLTGSSADALKQLQGEELAIAAAAAKCEAKFIEPVTEKIETELFGAPQN